MPTEKPHCTEHTIEINNLKKDMESVLRHDKKFSAAITDFDMAIKDFGTSIMKINHTLENFQEIPLKVRKLEDRSLVGVFVEKILWIAVGALLTVFINENYIATREKNDYKVEKKNDSNT